jgi:gliding motility-associated-like protein
VGLTPSGVVKLCQNDTLKLAASPNKLGGGNRYTWYPGLENDIDTLKVWAGGTYYVVVGDFRGCTAQTDVVTITMSPLPFVDIIPLGSTTICEGMSLDLHADTVSTDSVTFQWRNGPSTQDYTVSPAPGTYVYKVTVTDKNGCRQSDSVTVNVIPKASVSISSSPSPGVVCQGNSVTLTATAVGGGIGYQWQRNGVTLVGATGNTYNAVSSGNYRVIETSTCGSDTSSAIAVTVKPNPVATILSSGSAKYCYGTDSVRLTAVASNGLSWKWANSGVTLPYTDSSIVVKTPGIYTVTVTNTCGNKISVPFTVSFYEKAKASIVSSGPLEICPGSTVQLSTSAGAGYSYQWKKNGFNIAGADSGIYTTGDTGTYTVQVSNPCSDTLSVPVRVTLRGLPSVSYDKQDKDAFLCEGESVTVKASITTAYDSLVWLKNGIRMPGATLPELSISSLGSYKMVVYSCGNAIVNVPNLLASFNPLPVFELSPKEDTVIICTGTPVTFKVKGKSPASYSWEWSTGSHADSVLVNTADTVEVRATALYKMASDTTVTRACKASQRRQVLVDRTVEAAFLSTELPITSPAKVLFGNKSVNAISYTWYFADNTSSREKDPVHVYSVPGVYRVKLVSYNERGCADSVIREIRVVNDLKYMSSVFTPNEDGVNDFFGLSRLAEEAVILRGEIFDRWGKKIYDWEGNTGWNGKFFSGKNAPEATYFYVVRLKLPGTSPNDPPYIEKGSLTLLR